MENTNDRTPNKVFETFLVMGVINKPQDISYEIIEREGLKTDIIDIVPKVGQKEIPQELLGMKEFLFPDGMTIYDDKLNIISGTGAESTFKCETQFCKMYAKINPIHSKDLIFHFVTSGGDKESTKRYCTALLFHEKFYIKNDMKYKMKKQVSKSIPKIPIGNIIKNPLILDEDTDIIYIPKALCLISKKPMFQCQRQFLQYYYHNIIMGRIIGYRKRIIPVPNKLVKIFNDLVLQYGVKLGEKLWDTNYNTIISKLDKEISIQYKVKENHLNEFYLSYIFHLMDIPNENVSFSVYRTYKIDSGKTEDLMFKCRLFTRETISPPNFSYGPLLRRNLTQINLLKLIKNILLERFIIIFSSSPGEIACLTESILKLIEPLSYINVYVPFASVRYHLEKLLEYPGTSAILGFSKVYKEEVIQKLNQIGKQGKTVVIVDLDTNTIEEDSTNINIQLPQRPKHNLIKDLTNAEQDYKSKTNGSWERTVIEIQRAFFNFILFMINDFAQFFRKDIIEQLENATKEELNVLRNEKKYSIEDYFNIDSYLKMFPLEDQQFMREFTSNTMMFSYFLQQAFEVLCLKSYEKKSIVEFQESMTMVRKAKQDHLLTHFLDTRQQQYIDFENDDYTKELLYSQNQYILSICNMEEEQRSIYPFLIKWLKYLELCKLENLEGEKKKTQSVSFWSRFWSENILHFVDAEQRQQNRDQLNNNTSLYKSIDNKKFLNLKQLFQNPLPNSNLTSIKLDLHES